MQSIPLVSVIILNYNGLEYLNKIFKECVDSVLRTDYPNFEVIFVDNGSTDTSVDFVRENFMKSKIRIIKNEYNLGFSEGFNSGINASKGKYVALLSNDMTVEPSWLNPIVKLMEREPKIGLAGFKRLIYGTKNRIDGIGGDICLSGRIRGVGTYNEIDRGQYDTIREDLGFIGGAMVLRRKAIQEVGPFDPDYFIFSEDIDLCYRLRKQGYKTIYVPDAIIYHKGQATLKGMDPRGQYLAYMSHRSRIRCNLIHFTLIRLFSAFLIDLSWLFLANPTNKMLLLKAYWWNLKNIGTALKKRLHYGPSPPFGCKFPVTKFRPSDLLKRLRK